jgi:hypothetical protein
VISASSNAGATTTAPTVHGWLLALVACLLILLTLLAVVGLFGFFRSIQKSTFMEDLLERWITRLSPKPDSVTALVDEMITRRYEFLTFYGQFIVSALVVGAITVLLLTGTITADAGLPVLSTILGIVLGKTVLSRRSLPERPLEQNGASKDDEKGGRGKP